MKFGVNDRNTNTNKLMEAFSEFRPLSRVMVPRWGDPEGVRNGHKIFFKFSNFFASYIKSEVQIDRKMHFQVKNVYLT